MSWEHSGHMWINASLTQLTAFVQHYMHCKQRSPDGTSACILLPGYLLPVLTPMLSGMRLLRKFTKGAANFEHSSRSGRSSTSPGINWPVYTYSDAPTAVGKAFDDGHPLHGATVAAAADCPDLCCVGMCMPFEGSFGGASDNRMTAPILLDSGASTEFSSPCLLALSYSSSAAKLRVQKLPSWGQAGCRAFLTLVFQA